MFPGDFLHSFMVKEFEILVSTRDREIIEEVALCSPGDLPLFYLVEQLQKRIKNITANHYMVLGFVVGVIRGTEKTLEEFHNNQNPLSKCRAN